MAILFRQRWMYEDNLEVKDENWWVLVDQQLNEWRSAAPSERNLPECVPLCRPMKYCC
jgi:hypothetical protein